MKLIFCSIALLAIISAFSQQTVETADFSGIYANEYGEIQLHKLEGLKVRTTFKNNKGDVFDTTMLANYEHKRISCSDSLPFLQLGVKSGIEICPGYLFVHEFSAGLHLARFIRMENLLLRPFYKINEPITTIKGEIMFSKDGPTIDGIFLSDYRKSKTGYFYVSGIIKKEKYPIAYYSTKESPQGKFGDTSVVHYRLIMSEYRIAEPPKERYKGKLINNFGKAAFIWEHADSEIYYFENKKVWKGDEVGKEVIIEGVLIQYREKASIFKGWEIIKE